MKKIFVLVSLIILSSCFGGKDDTNDNTNDNTENTSGMNQENQDKIENIALSDEEIDTLRYEISLDNVSRLLSGDRDESQNALYQQGADFLENLNKYKGERLTDNMYAGIPVKFLNDSLKSIPENLIRDIKLSIEARESKTNQLVKEGIVYVNGVKLGELQNGKYSGNFKWVKGIEKFIITVRSDSYGDGFLVLNSLNSQGSLLSGEVYMKRAESKIVTLGRKQEINFNDTLISLDECSLVSKEGKCFKGRSKIKLTRITGDEANNYDVSLNMQSMSRDGELRDLVSGGMAFIDFVTDSSEILQLRDGETIKISYKVTQNDINAMLYKRFEKEQTEGYWWYDKNAGIWRDSDAVYILDKVKMLWNAEITNLY